MAPPLYGIFTTPNLFGFAIFFFLFAIVHRQLNNAGIRFQKWFAYIGFVPYFIADKFLPFRWALFILLVSGIILGFVGGMIFEGDEE